MIFTHRDDPARTATMARKEGQPAFVVQHTSADGKARKKTFKKGNPGQAHDAALRFLLNSEGYVLRAPQEGPVRWMARMQTDGYYGGLTHAVATDGTVWVGDVEHTVHRITPGTTETLRVPLPAFSGSSPRAVRGPDGAVWLVLPEASKVDGVLVEHRSVLLAECADDTVRFRQISRVPGGSCVRGASSTRDGHLLGPGGPGACLFGPGGEVIDAWETTAMTGDYGPVEPAAAISADGRFVAIATDAGMRRIDRDSGSEECLPADFKSVTSVQVLEDGTVFVSGFCYPSHGLFRLADGGQERISESTRAVVRDDGRVLVEADGGRITVRDVHRASEDPYQLRAIVARGHLPVLGMAKYGTACFTGRDEIVVITDAYTVAEIALGELGRGDP